MRIAIVGRGRLGSALGMAAQSAGHAVALLRRPGAAATEDSSAPEAVLGPELAWGGFDLVVLAFEKHATSLDELEADPSLGQLRRIPTTLPIASVVMSPSPDLLDAFLPRHSIVHFLTTPAARLPGAIALLRETGTDTSRLEQAFPALHWIRAEGPEYRRLALLSVGSAIAAAALAHLGRALDAPIQSTDADYLERVLDDAKRLLRMTEADGFRAFSLVATPGGFTEKVHDRIFAAKVPAGSSDES
jgi:hypothetical protein